jgi:hypothetical protein
VNNRQFIIDFQSHSCIKQGTWRLNNARPHLIERQLRHGGHHLAGDPPDPVLVAVHLHGQLERPVLAVRHTRPQLVRKARHLAGSIYGYAAV